MTGNRFCRNIFYSGSKDCFCNTHMDFMDRVVEQCDQNLFWIKPGSGEYKVEMSERDKDGKRSDVRSRWPNGSTGALTRRPSAPTRCLLIQSTTTTAAA